MFYSPAMLSLRRFLNLSSNLFPNSLKTFDKILIANRGEIACRIIKTAKKMGIKTVAVYSDEDYSSLHVKMADEAVNVVCEEWWNFILKGPAPTVKSYLNVDAILNALKVTGAQAVHPGYGFLSERAMFCQALDKIGVSFIGPSVPSLQAMGDKIQSKRIAREAGVNIIPGFSGIVETEEDAVKIARDIGYPVMIKASAGGGGKGMRIAWNDTETLENYRIAKSESKSIFGDDRLLVEKFIEEPRHIEIQLIGDKYGNMIYLPERECSIQRRNQKVIEEAPSSFMDSVTRKLMGEQAVSLAKKVGYFSAGTVEFLVDPRKNFYFLEMNTRLQVEHPITELITGLDLVECMIHVAAGNKLPFTQSDVSIKGWAVESRVYAEDPKKFLPCIGRLSKYVEPTTEDIKEGGAGIVRCDSGIVEGSNISMYYDPMICKLSTHAADRLSCISKMSAALDSYVIKGVTHNIPLLREVVSHEHFKEGKTSTNFLPREFPNGFDGHKLTRMESIELCTVAAYVALMKEQRNYEFLQGNMESNNIPTNEKLWISTSKNSEYCIQLLNNNDGTFKAIIHVENVDNPSEFTLEVCPKWLIESPIIQAKLNGSTVTVQYIESAAHGFTLQYLGTRYQMKVLTPRQKELYQHMIEKPVVDLSKVILSPMPGNIVGVFVKQGDIIKEGADLAIVEAMKMQNVLKAPSGGKVKAVNVKQGQNVIADEILIEME